MTNRGPSLLARATAAGTYLARAQEPSGRFRYRFDPWQPHRHAAMYGMIRHAGAAWSLAKLADRLKERLTAMPIGRAADQAVAYLIAQCRTDPDGMLYVDTGGPDRLSLGGPGLGLLAVAAGLARGLDVGEIARELGASLLALQLPGGRFTAYLGAPDAVRGSLYYPGEAMLGLVEYAQALGPEDGQPYLEAAHQGALYLIGEQTRAAEIGGQFPPDAWFAQTLERLWADRQDEQYLQHALQLGHGLLVNACWTRPLPLLAGSYGPLPVTSCRAAARAEGLLAVYRMAEHWLDQEGVPALLDLLDNFLQLTRDHVGAHQYGDGEGPASLGPPFAWARGGVAMSAEDPSIRIDTCQHSIAMWLGLLELKPFIAA